MYVNDDTWSAADGGELQYELRGESVKLSPMGGTVVAFDSRKILHEVLPTKRDRYAMTLWLVSNDLNLSANIS